MNKLIEDIFIGLLFKKQKHSIKYLDNDIDIYFYSNDNRAYFVIDISEKDEGVLSSFSNGFQGELFALLSEHVKALKSTMLKNSYLILTIPEIVRGKFNNKIFVNIEEDSYYFKKYVLFYAEAQVASLVEKVSSGEIVKSLAELASNINVFEKFNKVENGNNGFEGLLYKLFIKIPSLPLSVASKDFESLGNAINIEVELNKLIDDHNYLLSEIDKIDEGKINLDTFKKIFGGSNEQI